MKKEIFLDDKFFIAGASGMAGSAIYRSLVKKGYGDSNLGGEILTTSRTELDLLETKDVENWFKLNKPNVVIIAAAKVGGILANSKYPFDFIFENIKIQNNVIEAAWLNKVKRFTIYPKTHYVTPQSVIDNAIIEIKKELKTQLIFFQKENKLLEAQRLKERTNYDLAMMEEMGYCSGIENYSRYIAGTKPGEPPPCLLDYMPNDGLIKID